MFRSAMKIKNKIIMSYILNVAFILLIGFFSIHNIDLVLAKLKFVEIADDLNASFLEMRISEKNFFLYEDRAALSEINEKIKDNEDLIESASADISRAIGQDKLAQLRIYQKKYAEAADKIRENKVRDPRLELNLRTDGQKLRDFFKDITKFERRTVSSIILSSKELLYISFLCVLALAVAVGRFISLKILAPLQSIERLAISISKGDFRKIENIKSNDEVGSVIEAVNLMSEELKHRGEEILQSKKLASLGILTAGVAHEMTNPLNNISMLAQNFIEYYIFLSQEERIEMMDMVGDEAKRIEAVVKGLLDFSKPKEANMKLADINEAIVKSVKLMQNTLDISNVALNLSLYPALPAVLMDVNQIQQVFINVIVNAIQAMPGGGKLFIETLQESAEDMVIIKLTDTGKGISAECLPHIFDPFFTTKGVDGTGLGMSVSYGIIKSHNGNIRVESQLDAGTTFTIELPVCKR